MKTWSYVIDIQAKVVISKLLRTQFDLDWRLYILVFINLTRKLEESIWLFDYQTWSGNLSEGEVPKDLINYTNIMAGEDPADSFPKSPEMGD